MVLPCLSTRRPWSSLCCKLCCNLRPSWGSSTWAREARLRAAAGGWGATARCARCRAAAPWLRQLLLPVPMQSNWHPATARARLPLPHARATRAPWCAPPSHPAPPQGGPLGHHQGCGALAKLVSTRRACCRGRWRRPRCGDAAAHEVLSTHLYDTRRRPDFAASQARSPPSSPARGQHQV